MKPPHYFTYLVAFLFVVAACQTPPPATEPTKETQTPPLAPPVTPTDTAKPPENPQERKAVIERSLPESLLAAPAQDKAPRNIDYGTIVSARAADPKLNTGWKYRRTRQGHIVGFEFSNHGGNRILTPRRDALKNQFFTRDFQFRFDDRARQDIHLMISDWAPSRDKVFRLSELMNSLMHFFPRVYLPAIVNSAGRNIVTLPTGEEVEFDAKTNEILAGVLSEMPVDLNPDRNARQFPAIGYTGAGVVVRADSRGSDPRIGTTATITSATLPSACVNPSGCGQCQVPSPELWDQSGAVRFKFQTDQEFDRFLTARCGFGLPRIGQDFAVATPQK